MTEPADTTYRQYYEDNDPGEILLRNSLRRLGRDLNGQPLPASPLLGALQQEQATTEGGETPLEPLGAPTPEQPTELPVDPTQFAFPATKLEDPLQAERRAIGAQGGRFLGKEIPLVSPAMRAVQKGTNDALINMAKTFDDFTALFKEKVAGTPLESVTSIFPTKLGPVIEKYATLPIPEPTSAPGLLAKNAMQFVTAFSAYSATFGTLGLPTLLASIPAQFAASFSAFDPQSPNIANMLRDLAPPLRGPVLDALATDKLDGGAEERLRERLGTAVAETIPNIAIEGMIGAVKMIHAATKGFPKLPPGRIVPKLAEHFATDAESVGSTARAMALGRAEALGTPEGLEQAVDVLVRQHGVEPGTARQAIQKAMGSPGQLALGLVEKHLGKLTEPATFNSAIETLQQMTNIPRDEAARLLSDTYGAAFGTPGFFQRKLPEGPRAPTASPLRQLPEGPPPAPPPAPPAIPLPEQFAQASAPELATRLVLRGGKTAQTPEGVERAVQAIVQQTGMSREQADTVLGEAFDRVRGLLQGATPDDLPKGAVEGIVRELKREAPPEVLDYFGEQGFSQLGVIIALARTGGGAVIGGSIGDTPDERIRNALIGAGVGALASPALLRRLTKAGPKTPVETEIAAVTQQVRREALGRNIGERVSQVAASTADAAKEFAKNIFARSGRTAAEVSANTGETLESQMAQMRNLRTGMQAAGTVPEGIIRDVHYDKLLTTDDIKRTIGAISETLEPDIAAARKLGTPQEETKRLASLMGMKVDDLLNQADAGFIDSRTAYASQVMLIDSATELDRLATLVEKGDQSAYQGFLKQFVLHGEIQKAAAGIRAEAGRTLGILRAGRSGQLEYYQAMQDALEKMDVPVSAEGITAERLAEMIKGLRTPQALNTFTRQATTQGPTKTQAFIEAYINGLLSGPQTHVTQMVSNALTTAWAIPEKFLSVANAKVMGQDADFGEAMQLWYGMIEGYQDFFRLAAKGFRGEAQFGTVGQTAELYRPAITAETFALARESGIGRGVELLGSAIRTPTRALNAVDEAFKGVNYRMMLRKEAYAAAQTLPEADRASFIAGFLADPPVSVVEKAQKFAFYQTFQNALGESDVPFARLGKAAGHFQRFAATHPMARLFFPFIKTPTNILRYTFERSGPLALASREVRAAIGRGGVDRAEALAKMELGSAMIAVTAYLASQGYITGPGSRNPNLQQDMQAMGFRPFSLRIPGTDNIVALERGDPLSNFLIQGAMLAQLNGAAPEQGLQEAALGTVLGFMKAFSNKTFLTGFSQVVDLLSGRGQSEDAAMKPFSKAISRILTSAEPAVLRQLERAMDPEIRESHNMLEALMAVTPGLSDSLPVTRNNLAQPVLYGHGTSEGMLNTGVRFFSPFPVVKLEQLPANKLLLENGLDLDKPLSRIEGVELTPQQNEKYLILARDGLTIGGKTFRERLDEWYADPAFRRLSPGPDGEQGLRIRSMALKHATLARNAMLNASRPEYDAALAKKVQEERMKNIGQRLGTVGPEAVESGIQQGLKVLDRSRRPTLGQ